MSGDDLRETCCPDLWDRINELEAEREKLRGRIDDVVDAAKTYDNTDYFGGSKTGRAIDNLAAYRRENK